VTITCSFLLFLISRTEKYIHPRCSIFSLSGDFIDKGNIEQRPSIRQVQKEAIVKLLFFAALRCLILFTVRMWEISIASVNSEGKKIVIDSALRSILYLVTGLMQIMIFINYMMKIVPFKKTVSYTENNYILSAPNRNSISQKSNDEISLTDDTFSTSFDEQLYYETLADMHYSEDADYYGDIITTDIEQDDYNPNFTRTAERILIILLLAYFMIGFFMWGSHDACIYINNPNELTLIAKGSARIIMFFQFILMLSPLPGIMRDMNILSASFTLPIRENIFMHELSASIIIIASIIHVATHVAKIPIDNMFLYKMYILPFVTGILIIILMIVQIVTGYMAKKLELGLSIKLHSIISIFSVVLTLIHPWSEITGRPTLNTVVTSLILFFATIPYIFELYFRKSTIKVSVVPQKTQDESRMAILTINNIDNTKLSTSKMAPFYRISVDNDKTCAKPFTGIIHNNNLMFVISKSKNSDGISAYIHKNINNNINLTIQGPNMGALAKISLKCIDENKSIVLWSAGSGISGALSALTALSRKNNIKQIYFVYTDSGPISNVDQFINFAENIREEHNAINDCEMNIIYIVWCKGIGTPKNKLSKFYLKMDSKFIHKQRLSTNAVIDYIIEKEPREKHILYCGNKSICDDISDAVQRVIQQNPGEVINFEYETFD
jgi:ferredoxin-NADP reductase